MDFLGWYESAFFLALLTRWVFGNIACANFAPLPSIPAVYLWVALVLAIVVLSEFGVPIAVPAVAKLRASGIGAGRCRFARHHCLPVAMAKPRVGICPLGAVIYF